MFATKFSIVLFLFRYDLLKVLVLILYSQNVIFERMLFYALVQNDVNYETFQFQRFSGNFYVDSYLMSPLKVHNWKFWNDEKRNGVN